MTKEQIEGLEALARHGVSAFLDPMSKADAILRLLEERKRLLEALEFIFGEEEPDVCDEGGADLCGCWPSVGRAALAFVEEEG